MQVTWFRNVATAVVFVAGLVSGCTSDSTPTATDSIELTPDTQTIGVGATQQFKAEVVKDDNRTDVSGDASWTSSDESVATIDSSGLATGVAKGTATITAKLPTGATASATLTVTDAQLKELSLSPAKKSIAVGTTQDFTLTGTYTDGSSHDVSNSSGITWSSSSDSVASVDNKGTATAKSAGTTTISAKLMGVTGSTTLTVTGNEVTMLTIDPSPVSLANGTSQELKVTASFSDGSSQDVTGDADWSSDDSDVASISNEGDSKGTLSAKKSGTTNVKATFMDMTATVAVVVTDASLKSLAITPAKPSVAKGESIDLVVTGTFSDNSTQDLTSTVTWTSSDTAVATVSNAAGNKGSVTGLKTGTSKISASRNGTSTNVTLTVTDANLVSIDIGLDAPSLPNGVSVQLTATGNYSDQTSRDITSEVTWHSSDTDVVDVDDSDENKGEATGHAEGNATITATSGTITGTKQVTVSSAVLQAITISPLAPSMAKGTKLNFIAKGMYSDGTMSPITSTVTWSSSSTDTAQFSATEGQEGQITGKAAGTTMITASLNGITSSATTLMVTSATLTGIAITPATPSIAKGSTQQFTATGTFSDSSNQDITSQVTWSAQPSSIATIDNSAGHQGLATGMNSGSTQISAALGGITSSPVTLVVTAAMLVSIQVTPGSASVAVGNTQQFAAQGTYTDASHQDLTNSVTWDTGDTNTATINAAGLATGVATGNTSVSASLSGKTSNSVTLMVTGAVLQGVQITPLTASIANGTTQAFTANGVYSDGSHPDITSSVMWASSDTSVADISALGVATGASTGMTNITASYGGFTSTAAALTVTDAVLQRITVSPGSMQTLHQGQLLQFYANGEFSDNSVQDLTSAVTWASTQSSVLSISNTNVNDRRGRATGVMPGSAQVTASYGGTTSDPVDVTVDAPVLTAIEITPATVTLAKGLGQQYSALGHFSDGSTQDVTGTVTWGSSDAMVATISPTGHLDAVRAGTATITASDADSQVDSSADVTVTSAAVETIQISPSTPTIAQQTKLQFKATGLLTDNTQVDLTSAVLWGSDNEAVATVSNASGSAGLVSAAALSGGVPVALTIDAQYGGKTGTTMLTVTPVTLTDIVVESTTLTRPKGLQARFTATGIFSDLTTQDLTTQVTWTSSDSTVATVSNAVGSEGVASTIDTGMTNISASLLGQMNSLTVTLTVNNETLSAVQIASTPTQGVTQIPKGTSVSYVATGTFTDGSHGNVSDDLTWSSNDTSVADLCPIGQQLPGKVCITGLAEGTVTITGSKVNTLGATITQDVQLIISPADLVSINITAPNSGIGLPTGLQKQYTATGTYTDGSTQDITNLVTWSIDSATSSVADVSNVTPIGLVTAKMVGTTNVNATLGSVSGSISLTVSPAILQIIDVSVPPVSLPKGLKTAFHATGIYSDMSQQDITNVANWASSDTAVATASNAPGHEGEVLGVDVGTTHITATANNGVMNIVGGTDLEVSAAILESIDITGGGSIALGNGASYTATGNYSDSTSHDITTDVDWSSSDTSIATIGLHDGAAQSVAVGTSQISAALGTIHSEATLAVTPAMLTTIQIGTVGSVSSTPNGTTMQFTATGIYTDLTNPDITAQVTWTVMPGSGNATISNALGSAGELTATAVGTVTVTATGSGGIFSTTTFTVSAAVVDSLTLTPLTPSIAKGTTKQFAVVANYSDGTHPTKTAEALWSTSDSSVALISNTAPSKGLASALSMGTTTITVTFGGQTAMTDLTVTDATLQTIVVSPANPITPLGFTTQFTATGHYSDASTQDLTNAVQWTSSNPSAAIISNATGSKGLASTNAAAMSTTIKATLGAINGSTMFTVDNATLQSIDLTPTSYTFVDCTCVDLAAVGNLSNGGTNDLTNTVTFQSDDATVVSVANNGGPSPLPALWQICPKSVTGTVSISATDPTSRVTTSTNVTNNMACP